MFTCSLYVYPLVCHPLCHPVSSLGVSPCVSSHVSSCVFLGCHRQCHSPASCSPTDIWDDSLMNIILSLFVCILVIYCKVLLFSASLDLVKAFTGLGVKPKDNNAASLVGWMVDYLVPNRSDHDLG